MPTNARKLVIGLTGGIGSGKTAASDWFAAQGIDIVDTDIVARQVVVAGSPALTEIAETFGPQILQADGTLDRAAMRQIVFNDPQARQQLEQITHPRIQQQIRAELATATSPYIILVSALLLESQQHLLTARVLLIDAPASLQQVRASARDGQSVESINKIINAQMPRDTRLERADDVVRNDADLTQLHTQLAQLHQQYLQLAIQ